MVVVVVVVVGVVVVVVVGAVVTVHSPSSGVHAAHLHCAPQPSRIVLMAVTQLGSRGRLVIASVNLGGNGVVVVQLPWRRAPL